MGDTEEFIRETVFKGILNNYEYPALRKQRIELEINPNPKVPEGSTCDISISGVRFSSLCRQCKGAFCYYDKSLKS